MTAKEGQLIQNSKGHFVQGRSGNPVGRPKGSKNKITLLKMATEEAWRERNMEKLDMLLDMILDAALDGDKSARKMIFDSLISKASFQEDKAGGNRQEIKVHRMVVNQSTKPKDKGEEENKDE